MTVASGPLTIASGDSAIVAFALIAGENLASIEASAIAAQTKYEALSSVISVAPLNPGLSQNFPNPFSGTTTIGYTISGYEKVTIEVFDLLGSKVKTLVDESLSTGYYTVPFSTEGLSDGVYYCRMTSGDLVQVIKMISIQ
jgi:Secretion system C-terminal sorting domain